MKHALAFAVTAAVLSISSPVFAADTAPTNPNILSAIQQLQQSDVQEAATLLSIQQTLANIQAALQPTVSNAASTPLIPLTPAPGVTQAVNCAVTNLSSESRTVTIKIYSFGATPVFTVSETIPAGSSGIVAVGSTELVGGARCGFTVTNGTKQDIVAAITVVTFAGSTLTDINTVAAQ